MTIFATPTIQSNNNTLLELWESVLPRLDLARNSVDFLTSCQEVINIIVDQLWVRNSDFLKTTVDFTIDGTTTAVSLPPDYLGMDYFPYLIDVDNNVMLMANINKNDKYNYIGITDKPKYFDLSGFTLTVYPTPDTTYTLRLDYYAEPAALNDFSSLLPFGGFFNDIIADNAVKISNLGYSILADQTFIGSIVQKVDRTVSKRVQRDIYFTGTASGNQPSYGRNNSRYF
jgi:hypothetical protein